MGVTSYPKTLRNGSVVTYHRVSYYDEFGKRKQKHFTTKREALAFDQRVAGLVDEVRIAQRIVVTTDPTKRIPSFADAAREYVASSKQGRDGAKPWRENTAKTTTMRLDLALAHLGDKRIDKITRKDVKDLRDVLLTTHSRRTVRSVIGIVSSVYNWLIDEERVALNPATRIKVDLENDDEDSFDEHRMPSRREAQAIAEAVRHLRSTGYSVSREKWHTAGTYILTLLTTGLRPSEVRALTPAALLNNNEIRVFKAADRSGAILEPKTARGRRIVPAPADVHVELRALAKGKRDDELLFSTEASNAFGIEAKGGRPLDPQNINKRIWKPVKELAKLRDGVDQYGMRHFFASELIASGTDTKTVSALMGHADEAFTLKTYAKLFNDRKDRDKRADIASLMSKSVGL